MEQFPGMIKPELRALPKVSDRMTFLYVEYCQISRENSAIVMRDKRGSSSIPAGTISVLILGPGTTITHRAIELIGDAGVTVIWAGEQGVRYYASGRPLTSSASLLLKQAELVTNQRKHLAVARKMYEMRFPGEDVSGLSMQQLRGKEGARIRNVYRKSSEEWGIPWSGRQYDPDDFNSSDPVNQALSAGHQCLYGLAHAVIVSLGCSPGLGFVHVGHENSFVYDIADLYKAEVTIPLAFEIAASGSENLSSAMRRRTRDELIRKHVLQRMVKDIQILLMEASDESNEEAIFLWDDRLGTVEHGKSYGEEVLEPSL